MDIRSEDQKRLLQNRLNRLEGQLRGVNRMIGEDRNCTEVLQQLTAIRAALQGTIETYLEGMVNDCLLADNIDPSTRRKLADEVLSVIHRI